MHVVQTLSQTRRGSHVSYTMAQADAAWYQPVAHEPDLHVHMSDQARCFRQPFSVAIAALLARRDSRVQPGERGQR